METYLPISTFSKVGISIVPSLTTCPESKPLYSDMPRPPEDPDVRNSKTLAYILRHGAEKEGLHIRSDGFIKLADVVRLFFPSFISFVS